MRPQHVIALSASNVKRLTAVEIKLDKAAGTVILSGENASGKSSVIDAICMAIGGGSAKVPQPIRQGQEKARVVLTTEELVVTRRFTAEGSYLDVQNREGLKYAKPQELLDKLVAKVGFDPLAFSRLDAKQQTQTLLKICPIGLDLEAHEEKVTEHYEHRRDANREVERLKATLATSPAPAADTPTIEVSISALAGQLSALQTEQDQHLGRERVLQSHRDMAERMRLHLADLQTKVAAVSAELAKKQAEVQAYESAPQKDVRPEIERLRSQIGEAETANTKVRAAATYRERSQQLSEAEARAKAQDDSLKALADKRTAALHAAKFPVEGLSVDSEGKLVYRGVLLTQCSSAEQIRIGVAIAAASNPTLKVAFIRDGSLLDANSMAALEEIAQQHGLQIWVERVEDDSPAAIHIVEGSNIGAKDAPAEPEKKPEPTSTVAAAPDAPRIAEDNGVDLMSDTAVSPEALAPKKKGQRRKGSPDLFRA